MCAVAGVMNALATLVLARRESARSTGRALSLYLVTNPFLLGPVHDPEQRSSVCKPVTRPQRSR